METHQTAADETCRMYSRRPKLSDFGFAVEDSSVFHRPQWSKFPLVVLAIYRVIIALYVFGFFIAALVVGIQNQGAASFVYLTTWAFMIFIAYNVTAAINVTWDGYVRRSGPAEECRIRHKTHCLLFSTTTNLNILVTIVYWGFLHLPSIPVIVDVNMHTLPSVICLIDLCLTAIPVRLLHCIYPILLCVTYLIFTLVFWAAGGFGKQAIYPLLDYSNDPGKAVGVIFAIFFGICLLQVVIWAVYRFRLWIWGRCDAGASRHTQYSVLCQEEHYPTHEASAEDSSLT